MTGSHSEAAARPLVFVVGEALIDVVVTTHGEAKFVGGSPMNVACGLARLSVSTALRTQIGNDDNGRLIQNHLVAEGVILDNDSVGPERTSTAIAHIQRDGHAEYVFDVAWRSARIEVPPGVQFVHTGSIASALAPGCKDIATLFARMDSHVIRSFDPNVRPGVLPARDRLLVTTDRIAALSHIVKMSDEDAQWLHPGMDLITVIDRYLALGASVVAITRGGDGCVIASASARVVRRAEPVEVVDTIGAGDAFMSGILFALHALSMSDRIRSGDISETDLDAIALIAAESARIVVSRAGPTPPTLAELQKELEGRLPLLQ
jgi:fructokinase